MYMCVGYFFPICFPLPQLLLAVTAPFYQSLATSEKNSFSNFICFISMHTFWPCFHAVRAGPCPFIFIYSSALFECIMGSITTCP